MANRVKGYYWVRQHDYWFPCLYMGSYWNAAGDDKKLQSTDFDEIGYEVERKPMSQEKLFDERAKIVVDRVLEAFKITPYKEVKGVKLEDDNG